MWIGVREGFEVQFLADKAPEQPPRPRPVRRYAAAGVSPP